MYICSALKVHMLVSFTLPRPLLYRHFFCDSIRSVYYSAAGSEWVMVVSVCTKYNICPYAQHHRDAPYITDMWSTRMVRANSRARHIIVEAHIVKLRIIVYVGLIGICAWFVLCIVHNTQALNNNVNITHTATLTTYDCAYISLLDIA